MSIFQTPVQANNGKITSYYKARNGGFHDGIDYRAQTGTQVLAAYGGTVYRAAENTTSIFGHVVIIDHGVINGKRTYTLYAHLSAYSVQAGDTVEAGQQIGSSGTGGTGPHLHFEVLQSVDENPIPNLLSSVGSLGIDTHGYAVNPLQFVLGDGENITHTINTENDTGQNFATAWGDTGNDTFITPAPNAEFTAANLSGKRGNDLLIGNINSNKLRGGSGNDTLVGGAGSDTLWGWEETADGSVVPERIRETADDGGNDTLVGGANALEDDNAEDQMNGGNGFDIYHAGNGDIIKDSDGKGRIFYNGTPLTIGFHGPEQDENEYVSIDSRFTYLRSGDDLIVTVNGSEPPVSFTIQDYSDDSLGILLRDMPSIEYSAPYLSTVGEAAGFHYIGSHVDPNIPDFVPDAHDAIIGRAGNSFMRVSPLVAPGTVIYGDGPEVSSQDQGMDLIHLDALPDLIPQQTEGAIVLAQGGNDLVLGTQNHDWIEGGSGLDMLQGNRGNDVVIGGLGNDNIAGWEGDDILIANELGGTPSNPSDNNLMFGEYGSDYIFGGAGIDWIYGDTLGPFQAADPATNYQSWLGGQFPPNPEAPQSVFDYSESILSHIQTALYRDPLDIHAGNDFIDAGAGDDLAFGGSGYDVMYGSEGEDTLQGEAGDDLLHGGADNDYLYGDFWAHSRELDTTVIGHDTVYGDFIHREHQHHNSVDVIGHDLLDGGVGSDVLQGGHGDDVYVFNQGYGVDIAYDKDGNATASDWGRE